MSFNFLTPNFKRLGVFIKMKQEKGKEGTKVNKNPAWKRKIHYAIIKDKRIFYLCNQACNTFPEKRTLDWKKVTCRNCLNRRKK